MERFSILPWHIWLRPQIYQSCWHAMRWWLDMAWIGLYVFGVIWAYAVPVDAVQGTAFRWIYFHVPWATISLGCYGLLFVWALVYWIWHTKVTIGWMLSLLPIGVSATAWMLLTGILWGRCTWGAGWFWDPRLISALLLWCIYLALWLIAKSPQPFSSKARLLCLWVLVGALDIPLIYGSVYWWDSLHQQATFSLWHPSQMATVMVGPLWMMSLALFIWALKKWLANMNGWWQQQLT